VMVLMAAHCICPVISELRIEPLMQSSNQLRAPPSVTVGPT
jgi:hypothetical protein